MNRNLFFNLAADASLLFFMLLTTWYLTEHASPIDVWWIDGPEYRRPHAPVEAMGIMATYMWIAPAALLIVMSLLITKSKKRTLYVLFVWVQANIVTIFVTSLFRYFLPEPRPFFASVCNPQKPMGYINDPALCADRFARRDVQSFPSGHASQVWCTYVFAMLMMTLLSRTLHRLHGKRAKRAHFWKFAVFVLAMLVVPIWISCKRITGGNHFLSDVLLGSILGVLIAALVFANVDADYILRSRDKDKTLPMTTMTTMPTNNVPVILPFCNVALRQQQQLQQQQRGCSDDCASPSP